MSFEGQTHTVIELVGAGVLWVEDGNHGENRPLAAEFEAVGTPFIRPDDLKHGVVQFNGCDRINETAFKRVRKGKGRAGDIVFTHRATVGRIARVPSEAPDFVANPGVTVYRSTQPEVLDPNYLYYFMQGSFFMDQVWAEAGNTDTFPYISLTQQRRLKLLLPSIELQRSIGAVLGSLDDRITLLRETNATLEAIAQALFKSWFVDFDPVRAKMAGRAPEGMDEATAALFPDALEETELGLVPKGWQLTPLADAFEFNPSRPLKKGVLAPYLDMASVATSGHRTDAPIQRELGSGTKFCNGDTLLARITPCLENGKAAFVDFLADGQVGWGSTEFLVMRPRGTLPEYFAYLLCKHQPFLDFAIQSMVGTSGRQRIQNEALGRYLIAVPPGAIALAFGQVVDALQSSIAANDGQSKTLATLRDTLLPRLISGQLRLPEAQGLAEETAAH